MDRARSDANIHSVLAKTLPGRDKFDALLIDEAQDLTADNLKCLIGLAKRERHVAVFSDENQTIFSLEPRHGAQKAWEFPKTEVFGAEEVVTRELSTNIRNTDRIFEVCRQLSDERTRPGHIIEGVEVAKTSEPCKEIIERLREKNHYSPGDIVVLAPRKELLPTGDDIFTDNLDVWWKNCKVLRATIQSFKGLDANCVIFLGSKMCTDELKYEAMSRAKYELYIVE
jgi:superfamily I DNA and RNA helicase